MRDIAAIIDMIETYPHDGDYANIIRIAQDRMQLKVDLLPPDPLPAPGPKAVLLDPRRCPFRRDHPPDQPPVLDRHGRQFQHRRGPHPARGQGAARLRAPQPGLCLQHPHLPDLDGRHLAGAADDRHPLPAQPDPADPDAGRGRRKLRQGPADAARFPPARRRGGAPRRLCLHPDARAHRTPDRAAHRHADRRQP